MDPSDPLDPFLVNHYVRPQKDIAHILERIVVPPDSSLKLPTLDHQKARQFAIGLLDCCDFYEMRDLLGSDPSAAHHFLGCSAALGPRVLLHPKVSTAIDRARDGKRYFFLASVVLHFLDEIESRP